MQNKEFNNNGKQTCSTDSGKVSLNRKGSGASRDRTAKDEIPRKKKNLLLVVDRFG